MSDSNSKKKKFLIIAIAVGVFGILVGGITIWNVASQLSKP